MKLLLSNDQIICILIRWLLSAMKVANTTVNGGRPTAVKVRQRVNIHLSLSLSVAVGESFTGNRAPTQTTLICSLFYHVLLMLNMYMSVWLAEWVNTLRHVKMASCFSYWWNVSTSINRFLLPFIFVRPSDCTKSFPLQQPVNGFPLFCKIWVSHNVIYLFFFFWFYVGG
jgi:hypothetical protein